MKDTLLTQATGKVVALKVKAIDQVIEKIVEPLEDVGNPEKLIGKPYDQWTVEDIAFLTKIYGKGEDTPLVRTIFNKEFEKVKALEAEEL